MKNSNTKKLRKIFAVTSLSLLSGLGVLAQNSSADIDAIPIGGANSCAFGWQSLFNNNSNDNAAFGFNSLWGNQQGNYNSGFGSNALYGNKTGSNNATLGAYSLFNANNANNNSGFGAYAMFSNTTGSSNTAGGYQALYTNNVGSGLTAFGNQSMYSNTTGTENTALGNLSLYANTIGWRNTAVGHMALTANTSGYENTAVGEWALLSNTSGNDNTAIGLWTMFSNTTGYYNAAIGYGALAYNTTGQHNAGMGTLSLRSNTTGQLNAACGTSALFNNVTGNCNSALGNGADVAANNLTNATAIGCGAVVNASNKIRLGDAAVTVVEGPVAYTISDGRFKTDVKEEDVKGLAFINKLRPVVYNFECKKFQEFITQDMPDSIRNAHLDKDFGPGTVIRQSGFIAQEVEKAAMDAGYNFNGVHKPESASDNYSLAYGQFVVPLVKGMQEQQQMIEAQKQTIDKLQQQLNEVMVLLSQTGKVTQEGTTQKVELTDKNAVVLNQNVPNPFAESTVITYQIPGEFSKAQILFTSVDGNIIKVVDIKEKGKGTLNVYANDLTNGLYKYTLVVDGKTIDTKSLIKN